MIPDSVLTVAYLANQFPSAVEPYVGEEIEELRRRGVEVIPGSVRRADAAQCGLGGAAIEPEILCLRPVRVVTVLRAVGLVLRRWKRIAGLVKRVVLRGKESPKLRLKAMVHTLLGAYYAVQLRGRGVDHVHVHHGYFGSWIGMVAARLQHFPRIDSRKILVSRLGVEVPVRAECSRRGDWGTHRSLSLLAVGRLHAVKDHAFLVRACARLRDCGLDFECVIAGEGPERRRLETLIREKRLQDQITLLGQVARPEMNSLYQRADVVVLTSRSEGIPLVLMEAMTRGRIVLAPAITGIPEIVIPGKTGFLYAPGVPQDLVAKILLLQRLSYGEGRNTVSQLDWIRHAARVQVFHNFSRRKNLTIFGDRFLKLIATRDLTHQSFAKQDFTDRVFSNQNFANQDFTNQDWSPTHEDLVLQQV